MAIHETKQSVFNVVWQAFIVERAPLSMNTEGDACRYRGENGAKCAVGVCIPDEWYDPDMDVLNRGDEQHIGTRINMIKMRFSDMYEAVFNGIDVGFLSDMQNAHDGAAHRPNTFHAQVRDALAYVAGVHRLTIPRPR